MSTGDGCPTVSVVVPLFEGERFVGEALESVQAQTWRDFEVVVVDDGSTDRGPALVEGLPGVRLVRRPHAGVAAARNEGIRATRGELIAFLDQDDRWRPRKLELQMERLRARPELGFVYALQRLFLEPGLEVPAWIRARDVGQDRPGVLPSTLLVRRSCFERVGLHDETFQLGTDVDWLARAVAAGLRYEVMPECLLDRRIHSANHSRITAEGSADLLRAMRRHLDRRRSLAPGAPD